jgi:hypothetical protein
MFLKGSTRLWRVPFGVSPNGMLEDASGGTPDTATETVALPKRETPIAHRYVKDQPRTFSRQANTLAHLRGF